MGKAEGMEKKIKWFLMGFILVFIVAFFLTGFIWPDYDAKSITFRFVVAGAGSYGTLSSFKSKKKKPK